MHGRVRIYGGHSIGLKATTSNMHRVAGEADGSSVMGKFMRGRDSRRRVAGSKLSPAQNALAPSQSCSSPPAL